LKRKEKSELYDAIGKFIFQYSQLEYQLRWNLAIEANIQNELSTILIGPYDFSMLCTVLERTLLKKKPAKEHDDINKFFKRCRAVNDVRVKIVHGSWSIWSVTHMSRQTLEEKQYPMPPAEIHKETLKIMELTKEAFGTVLD
jgi:hypothetical protein